MVDVSERLGFDLWLRGGWAMDFFLGRVTRSHEDVDFFIWSRDAATLATELGRCGYAEVVGPPREQQRDFSKDGEELSFALIDRDERGQVVVAGGPWAGAPWPDGMLEGAFGVMGGVRCRTISADAQVEIKEMMPVWVPGRPRRRKDRLDIKRLRAAMPDRL